MNNVFEVIFTQNTFDTNIKNKTCTFVIVFESPEVVKKATIRNSYNRITHPALETKQERNTCNLEGIK